VAAANEVDLNTPFVDQVTFREEERGRATDVLTNMRRKYSPDYIANRVNANIGEAFGDKFGEYAAALAERGGLSHNDVTVEDDGVSFPDGGYTVTYEAEDERRGTYLHEVWFGSSWFNRPERMLDVLRCLSIMPRDILLDISSKLSLDATLTALRSRGWTITSQRLPRSLSAKQGVAELEISEHSVRFRGFSAAELFGDEADETRVTLVSAVLSLLPKRKARPELPSGR
jgi:hypothetical protein